MNTRKWLAECHAWLDDPESVQVSYTEGGYWQGIREYWHSPLSSPQWGWRIKPKIMSINGREFPAPVDGSLRQWIRISTGNEESVFLHSTQEARDLHYKILVEESTPK